MKRLYSGEGEEKPVRDGNGLRGCQQWEAITPQSSRNKGGREVVVTGTQRDTGGHVRGCGLQDRTQPPPTRGLAGRWRNKCPALAFLQPRLPLTKQAKRRQNWGQGSPGTESSSCISWGAEQGRGEWRVNPKGKHSLYGIPCKPEGQMWLQGPSVGLIIQPQTML